MQIYNALESRYIPPLLANVPILLVRASAGEGADTPYRDLYRDEDFGWGKVAGQLEVVNVLGGHSSMLQEQAIESLATAMLERFPLSSLLRERLRLIGDRALSHRPVRTSEQFFA